MLENQEKPSEEVRKLKVEMSYRYRKEFNGTGSSVVSDIYGSYTNFYISGGKGHYDSNNQDNMKNYWWEKDETTEKWVRTKMSNAECFAEYYSINMVNDTTAKETTKKYLPESYSCMDEMIKEME